MNLQFGGADSERYADRTKPTIYSLNSFESKFTANRVIKSKFGIKYDQTVLVKKVTFQ